MVSYDLNNPSARGCCPQKVLPSLPPPPPYPDPPSVKEDLTGKVHKPDLNRVKDLSAGL